MYLPGLEKKDAPNGSSLHETPRHRRVDILIALPLDNRISSKVSFDFKRTKS